MHSRQVFEFDPMFVDSDISLNKTIALKGILRFGNEPCTDFNLKNCNQSIKVSLAMRLALQS